MQMKKTVLTRYGLMAALLSVLALPGCRNEEQDFSEPSEKTVKFRAGMAETRTAFGELGDGNYPTYWTANDEGVLLFRQKFESKLRIRFVFFCGEVFCLYI